MAGKRKRIVLTIEQKLEILNKLETGTTTREIIEEYGIGESTVRDITKRKDKLLTFASTSETYSTLKKRKSMKVSMYEELDKALLEWFTQQRALGTPVSGPIIISKANFFFHALGIDGEFDASSGWLTRFKQRYGIKDVIHGIHGEKVNGDQVAAEEFKREFQNFILSENLLPDQIYNTNESGLFWRCLPSRTLAFESECHKASKERITVMCCSNVTGEHKLPLTVVGKAKNPKSIKGTTVKNLPVIYYSQRKGWMDKQIFQDWFENHFVPQVRDYLSSKGLPEKAVLVLDNAPSHPSENILTTKDAVIFTKFLPPNVTALVQPMDQGIISSMKRQYRTTLLQKRIEDGCDLKSFWKDYSVIDSINDIANTWNLVKPINLFKSWRKLLPMINEDTDDSSTVIPATELAKLANSVPGGENVDEDDIIEWLECDLEDPGFEHLTDEEIVFRARGIEDDKEESEDDDDELLQPRVSHEMALQHVDGLLEYLDGQNDALLADKLVLRRLHAQIKQKCHLY